MIRIFVVRMPSFLFLLLGSSFAWSQSSSDFIAQCYEYGEQYDPTGTGYQSFCDGMATVTGIPSGLASHDDCLTYASQIDQTGLLYQSFCDVFFPADGGGGEPDEREAGPYEEGWHASCENSEYLGGRRSYSVYLPTHDGQTVAFQVLEPNRFDCTRLGAHPLLLHGPGYSGTRAISGFSSQREAGYTVISWDPRGFGETTGTVRVMDPEFGGQYFLQILDWAEQNLDYLAWRDEASGEFIPRPVTAVSVRGGPNLVVGSMGGSYGGGYQLMLLTVDAKSRLDALAPDITWHDLRSSLNPGDVVKSLWGVALSATGSAFGYGSGGGTIDGQDPFIEETVTRASAVNEWPRQSLNWFHYRGLGYWCAANGLPAKPYPAYGDDLIPMLDIAGSDNVPVRNADGSPGIGDYLIESDDPAKAFAGVNVLLSQSMVDTLFDFNQAWWNRICLEAAGAQVSVYTHNGGHAIPFGQAPDNIPTDSSQCDWDELAFFNAHLKPQGAAVDLADTCFALGSEGDVVHLPAEQVIAPLASERYTVRTLAPQDASLPGVIVPNGPIGIANTSGNGPIAVSLGVVENEGVLAGIPRLNVDIVSLAGLNETAHDAAGSDCRLASVPERTGCDSIIFAGLGVKTSGSPNFSLVDDQVIPLRTLGQHAVDMVGVAERLHVGDELAVLFFATHPQFFSSVSRDATLPTVVVSGEIGLPLYPVGGDGSPDPFAAVDVLPGGGPGAISPPVDSDDDGFDDAEDQCPQAAGDDQGCPDSDGDGFSDHRDECPAVMGSEQGCPPEEPEGSDAGGDDSTPPDNGDGGDQSPPSEGGTGDNDPTPPANTGGDNDGATDNNTNDDSSGSPADPSSGAGEGADGNTQGESQRRPSGSGSLNGLSLVLLAGLGMAGRQRRKKSLSQGRLLLLGCLALGLGACNSTSHDETSAHSQEPADAPGYDNSVPASPASGESRPGQSYSIYIEVPATGDTMAFTVHEPAELVGGESYPLVLYGHGGGEQRVTNPNDPATANQPINNPKKFIDNGYGVISMDQRGHGESTGTIRLLDPEFEGRNLLAMLDWAEANLDWLAYGPSADGSDANNLILGAIGASYGGAFQMLIHNIDPKNRLDAIIPEATWHDTNYSLAPGGATKSLWTAFLFGRLSFASNQFDPARQDPFVQSLSLDALISNQLNQEQKDFLTYHSNAYFCNGQPLLTNGGSENGPQFAPQPPGKINALFMQGMRDTLFNFNEAYWNYVCYKRAGGDVRLRSYLFGHNATPVIPDPGIRPTQPNFDPEEFTPPLDAYDNHCGEVNGHDAGLAFFAEHLKGIQGAADAIPREVCITLDAGDAVLVDSVTTGHAGTAVDIPPTTVIAGIPDAPIVVNLGITAGPEGEVLAGIPRLEIDLSAEAEAAPGDPIIFAGIGVLRAPLPPVPGPLIWELADNQITPLRGVGQHHIDLAGIGERLQPGDQVALLLYGGHNQYALNGSLSLGQASLSAVSISGRLWLPLLGPLPSA